MRTIHRHTDYTRGCPTCSRRAAAEAIACFVRQGIVPLREARRALRSKLSEEERAARIRALRAELAELEQEDEGRTDEDEVVRRTAEPSYQFLMDEDEDGSNIMQWDKGSSQGSNISRRKPEDNPLRGGPTGQQRSWGTIPGETGNLDPKRRGAAEAIAIFKRAGIRVRG